MFQSIRLKLTVFVILLLIFTTFAFSIVTVKNLNQTILDEIIKRAETLSKTSASAAAYSLISNDSLGIDQIVFKGKSSNSDVEYMAIVDKKMRILGHSDIKKRGEILKGAEGNLFKKNGDGTIVKEISLSSGRSFEISTPIVFKDKVLGTVIVGVNQSVLLEAQRLARHRIFVMLTVILVVGLIGILGLCFLITRPIKELCVGVEELKEGKRARPLRIYSKDELGKLTESFNNMSELITDQKKEIFKYTQELEEAYISILRVLAMAIDARDSYTLGHSARVALHSLIIGEEIGLKENELEELEIASLFHDVGKLKTPDAILFKSRSLDSTEYDVIRHHPEDGAEILNKVKPLQKYVEPVKHHHEYYNGKGYPDGLDGDGIPLYAAIISIADTYDAITSTRPYRKALSKEEACKELEKGAGKQFHPDLVKAFLRAMENGGQPSFHPYLTKVV
ncbi:MAG: HD domain-containing phosphohydrolase [Thermodesulfobacteriota bacterium]